VRLRVTMDWIIMVDEWFFGWLFGCLVYNKMIYCVKVFWNLSILACDLYALHAPVRMPFLPVVSMLG
jgi:hypothetical protein